MQADGRLVQHVEHAGGPVADRPGQLDALPLSGGKRGRSPVQGQIAQPQIHQTPGGVQKRFADIPGHGAHFLRQRIRNLLHPVLQLGEGHRRRCVKADSAQPRRAGFLGKPRSVTGGAHALLQEALNPLHPFVILDLGEGIFHRINCVVIGEIHLGALLCLRIDIDDVLLLRGAVIDHFLLFVRQILEGYIGAHAHLAAHILHQCPHERAPDRHRAFVDGQILIGHQRALVNGLCHAGTAADPAGTAGIECEVLRARPVKMLAANRADDFLHGRHGKRRRRVVSVRTAVARESREHQTQAVQQLGHGAEGAADSGHAGPLVQRQRRRNIAHVVHICPRGLCHPSSCVGGKRFQIAARAFRVEHAQRQGGFSRAGDPGDADDAVQGNIHVNIFQIMYSGPAHFHTAGCHLHVFSHVCLRNVRFCLTIAAAFCYMPSSLSLSFISAVQRSCPFLFR